MITVENYKAFHGVMRITPKTKCVPPLEVEGDWLYKPEYKCWYGNGASYGEDICTVVRDDTEKLKSKKLIQYEEHPNYYLCPNCRLEVTSYMNMNCCSECGQALDWSENE